MLSSIVFRFYLLLKKEAKWGEFDLPDIYTRYARKLFENLIKKFINHLNSHNVAVKMIKLAIVGIGNCASSLIQGIYHYENKNKDQCVGLLNYKIDNYKPSDIDIVAAFDIDERKVGKDVSEAIFAKPNNTKIFFENIPKIGTKVLRGTTFDDFPQHMNDYDENIRFKESPEKPVDVVKILKETKPYFLLDLC